ncbi:(2,3-dihydroxybenzoyl)adenylate synthase [Pseudomonas prosekii]|uniref:(2,3-dihydroxybenzoyl)adenylate synthase n=1 Tax=Pseudomonas prosekii TaxID=1148509 RepID=UPI0011EA7AA6|nr:AMP-binding protein [Pseudomonas prosekii]
MDGFVPFPPAFTQRYRDKGYWRDQTLAQTFSEVCEQFAERIAVCDAKTEVSYRQLDETATKLALNLLDAGLKPGEIAVLQLGNVLEFVYVYLALQKIGVVPILALQTHRYRELRQFVELSGATATITGDKAKDCDFVEIINRVAAETSTLKTKLVLGDAPEGFISLRELLAKTSSRTVAEIEAIQRGIDPCSPALFLLSGGTTGIPKMIPRSHNDYACNSRLAVKYTGIDEHSVLLDVLPIAHNLPLACPGLQGFMLSGAKVVLHTSTRAEEVFNLIQAFKVTHIHVVPALLIMWMNDPAIDAYDLSSVRVIQSGGQRLQPETRLLTEKILNNCTVQENFGMAEGLLMFVRLDDPIDVRRETVGRPICEDDEVLLLDEEDRPVAVGMPGEFCCRGPYTLRGYFNAPEHNARAFTPEGFYRSGDMMRLLPSGNYVVEGRKKDLINRGGEKISAEEIENLILGLPAVKNVACVAMPDPVLGEKMCAYVILKAGYNLDLETLVAYLQSQEIARFKLPERLEITDAFPLSTFGKVSKKDLVELVTSNLQQETLSHE